MAIRAAWTFDEATGNYTDASGNGFTAVPAPGITRTAGQRGGSDLAVTRTNTGRLATASGAIFTSAQTALSVTFWEWHPSSPPLGADINLVSFFAGAGADTDRGGIYFASYGKLGLWTAAGTGLEVNDLAPADAWTHIAVVWNGANWQVYFNGTLKSETAVQNGPLGWTLHHVDLGGVDEWGGSSAEHRMNDVRLWDHALTQAEVTADMTAVVGGGAPTFSGTLALSATGTSSRTGSASTGGTLARTATGASSRTGGATVAAAAALTGSGALDPRGAASVAASLGLAGSGALSAGGSVGFAGGLNGTASGGLDDGGATTFASVVLLTADGVLLLAPDNPDAAGLDLTGEGALLLGGTASLAGSLSLEGSGTQVRQGAPVFAGTLTRTASGTQVRTGALVGSGTLALTAVGNLSPLGYEPGSGNGGTVLVDGVERAMTVTLWLDGQEVPVTVEGVWVDGQVRPLV